MKRFLVPPVAHCCEGSSQGAPDSLPAAVPRPHPSSRRATKRKTGIVMVKRSRVPGLS